MSRLQRGADPANRIDTPQLYRERDQPLQLELLREDRSTATEATVLDAEYTVPAPEADGDSAGTIRETDVAPERQYLVRVLLNRGRFERFHSHYYPDSSTEEMIDIGIYRDEATEHYFVDFRSLS